VIFVEILRVIGLILVVLGLILSYTSKIIVKKYDLAQNQTVKFADEMSEQEIEEYKRNKAIAKVKMVGILLIMPGIFFVMHARQMK
jgi:hypothetical protein